MSLTFPWIVGAVLTSAAVLKIADIVNGELHPSRIGTWFDSLQTASILPEVVLGFLLLGGVPSRRVLVWSLWFVLCLTVVTAMLMLLRGPTSTCKCFGGRILVPVYWHLVLDGTLMMLLAGALVQKPDTTEVACNAAH